MSAAPPVAPPLRAYRYVSYDTAARAAAATDRSGVAGELPLAVARPESVAEVQDVVRAAWRAGVPVIPRGAGTGMAGGAAATADALVLDLSELDRIVTVDAVNRVAVVEPGVLTADLDRAAAVHGLRYAPDPASAGISTIGGNVATNAGGLRCLKYGVTRDAVRSLDVVLADGRLVRVGSSTAKAAAGYDLTRLFVGSEGTLGIIVGATVALRPLPVATATISATFATAAGAAAGAARIGASGVEPSVLELIDAPTLAAIHAHLGLESEASGAAVLIVQTEGFGAEAEALAVRAALEPTALRLELTSDPARAEQLLATRRAALPALEAIGTVFIEDICVPISRLAEAVDRVQAIAAARGVRIFTFAHAGDGNLHPIIVADAATPAVHAAADDLFALALELDGTITGEHGVGLVKREWLHRELDPVALELQRAIRRTLDPNAQLNPGKAI